MVVEHEGKIGYIECTKRHCFRAGRRCPYAVDAGENGIRYGRCDLFGKELPIDANGIPSRLPECVLKKEFAGRGLYPRLTRRDSCAGQEREVPYEQIYYRLCELEDMIEGVRHDV